MGTELERFDESATRQADIEPLAEAFRRLAPRVTPTIVYAAARRRIFSWRSDPGETAVIVRVGEEFRAAPRPVAEAIVRIVTKERLPRDIRRRLFFEIRSFATAAAPTAAAPGRCRPPEGRYVDLRPVLLRVGSEHFPQPIAARIGWSLEPARHLMGRFERGSPAGLVIVNRLLDSPLSPGWYLDFLVFHELLHAVIPPRPGSSRLIIHPIEFRRIERRHPSHAQARLFERWISGQGYRLLLEPPRPGTRLPARFREAD